MLVFEHTQGNLAEIDPKILVTSNPFVWVWKAPNVNLALPDWYEELGLVDIERIQDVVIAAVMLMLGQRLLKIDSKEGMLVTPDSFYWDTLNQKLYIHVKRRWLPAQRSISLNALVGYTDFKIYEAPSGNYSPLLTEVPNISESVDPLNYGRMANSSFSFRIRNDEVIRIDREGKPYKTYRFDDLSSFVGQIGFIRIGKYTEAYDKLRMVFKGTVDDYSITPNFISMKLKDIRASITHQYPFTKFKDLRIEIDDYPYMEEDIEETTVPDGYGYCKQIPAYPLNSKPFDKLDEDQRYRDYEYYGESLVSEELDTWSNGNLTPTWTTRQIANRTMYRIEKTEASDQKAAVNFTADKSYIVCGYVQGVVQVGQVYIRVYAGGSMQSGVSIDFLNETHTVEGGSTNCKCKFLDDTENKTVFFSFETGAISGAHQLAIMPDESAGPSSVCYVAGVKLLNVVYPEFKVASVITGSGFNIGDTGPAGGLIFHQEGETYYEVAPEGWDGGDDPGITWGGYLVTIGGTSQSVGTGKANTEKIVAELGAGTYAAKACDDYSRTHGGKTYTDWFLPSDDELNLMYENLHEEALGGFLDNRYWSSSEASSTDAYSQKFDTGERASWIKNSNLSVRPVRKFNVNFAYKIVDDEAIPVTPVSVDEENGTFTLAPADCHVDGDINKNQVKIVVDTALRAQTNPFDIIVDLNDRVQGFSYLEDFYNFEECERERDKLAPVSYYMPEPQALFQHIEELQSGSVIGFQYDDRDKIRIACDDPNRDIKTVIYKEQIINKNEIEREENLTLYATKVTAEYGINYRTNVSKTYTNTDYELTATNIHRQPKEEIVPTLLNTEQDAMNKTIVMLEDLSSPKPIFTVEVNALEFSDLRLYDIIRCEASLIARRFSGFIRAQVIGIDINMSREITTLRLRKTDYSIAVENIIGVYRREWAFLRQYSASEFSLRRELLDAIEEE